MTDVIPPGTLYKIHPFDQYTPEQNNLWKQLFTILDQLYLRVGGPSDNIDVGQEERSANDNQIHSHASQIAKLFEELRMLKKQDVLSQRVHRALRPVTVTSSYTAISDDYVNASNSVTITFPSNPPRNARVVVRVDDASTVIVDGNGKNINGRSTDTICGVGSVADFFYFIDDDEWYNT